MKKISISWIKNKIIIIKKVFILLKIIKNIIIIKKVFILIKIIIKKVFILIKINKKINNNNNKNSLIKENTMKI